MFSTTSIGFTMSTNHFDFQLVLITPICTNLNSCYSSIINFYHLDLLYVMIFKDGVHGFLFKAMSVLLGEFRSDYAVVSRKLIQQNLGSIPFPLRTSNSIYVVTTFRQK